ncbi:MAG: polysaccharide biosynthesis/export family protein [Pseudomonadota bacterium]
MLSRVMAKQISLCFFGAFMLSACASSAPQVSQENDATVRVYQEYRLGSGDDLRITVFGQDDLSGEYNVSGNGTISLPLIGQMEVIDLTTVEAEAKITRALEGDYLRNPRVNVDITNYRPYTILGEVRSPGQFPYRSGLTVIEAVAQSGGFTYRANEKVVLIKSKDSTEEVSVVLDGNTLVQPGDSIRIKERFF